jgi:hypothetical protein
MPGLRPSKQKTRIRLGLQTEACLPPPTSDEKSTRAPADFGPYVIRAARRGLWNAAKDLLFAANARSCGTKLLRHAHLHRQQTKPPGHCPGGLDRTLKAPTEQAFRLRRSDPSVICCWSYDDVRN